MGDFFSGGLMMAIWRLHLKPAAKKGIDSRKFCIDRNILGIGWPVEEEEPLAWETYYALGRNKYGNKGWRAAIRAIGKRMSVGDLCWTRDGSKGNYYVGKIDGGWEYRSTAEHRSADIVNVRRCSWFQTGGVDSVPGKVFNNFISPSAVREVPDEDGSVALYSKWKNNELSRSTFYKLNRIDKIDIYSLISPYDCEDIVALYLQEELNYRLIPSTCRRSTARTEFVMKTTDGKQANVQVKQGPYLNKDNFRYDPCNPCEWFLFTTSGQYAGEGDDHVCCLAPAEIHTFALKNRELMSSRVQSFIDFLDWAKELPATLREGDACL